MYVQTVLGPIGTEAIGMTDCHEHLFIRGGMPVLQYPDFHFDYYQKISTEAALFAASGGNTIIEMSPIDRGRDAAGLIRLSRSTGLHIVAATGFNKISYYPDIHWIHSYHEDDILKIICDELEVGMDIDNYSGPLVSRSTARAGVIKIGTQRKPFSDIEQKLLRVVAEAHRKTGAPIITYTDEGELALEQIEFLVKHRVNPRYIALSHMDRCLDLSYHKEIASTGAYLEYDTFTRDNREFDKSPRQLVIDMFENGYGANLLLGGDIFRKEYWKSYLSRAGLPPDALDLICVRNPQAFLTWACAVEVPKGREPAASEISAVAQIGTCANGTPMRKALRTVRDFVDQGLVSKADEPLINKVAQNFSIAMSSDLVAANSDHGGNGPVGRQFVPSAAELEVDDRELADPIGDKVYARTKAVIHRYPDRVLLKPIHTCPVYCRFCFRRASVGRGPEPITDVDLREALAYIRSQPSVREVILTGGDPLMLPDSRLKMIIGALHNIDHVEVIRIHTRYPIAYPARITDELTRSLRGRAAVYVVLHCNHPQELTGKARAACACFVDNGIPMLSQSVLLRGVNDDPDTMAELMRLLVRLRIKPYYLHHLDLARGTSHFRTSVAQGQTIMQRLRGRLSGLCQPTYVLDIPGGHGKVPIGPIYLQPGPDLGEYVVEDYRGEKHAYADLCVTPVANQKISATGSIEGLTGGLER